MTHNSILYSALLELASSILLLLDNCRRDIKCIAEGEIKKRETQKKNCLSLVLLLKNRHMPQPLIECRTVNHSQFTGLAL